MAALKKLVCLAIVFSGATLFAQQITASLRGLVTDPSNAVVENATVTATQSETGLKRTTSTDRNGAYVLLELPVGHYQLQVEGKGFHRYVQQGIILNVNETATVPVRLTIGAEGEKVEVNADAELIQNTISSLGTVVSEREVLDLPLNGRNFTQLGLLQPGVVPLTPGLQEAGGSLRAGQAYAVNGQRPESNNFLIDGANNFNGVDGGFVLKPPVDAVSEFRILTHNSNAEFGNSLGSTTNIITRSGTNQIHGAVWEFLRNDVFDATNYFADKTEPLKQNQFGVTLGGPIRKDKTFLFGYYEGFRNRQGETDSATVPSMAERQGDFSAICTAGFSGGFCNDPNQQLFNVFMNEPYPNNQLPPEFMNPLSLGLLDYFPEPNAGTNVFTSTQVVRQDSNQFGLRLDHYISSSDVLNFRYMFNDGSEFHPIPISGAGVPGFPVGQRQRAQNFVMQETHTFSPSMIGVFRFSFLRNKFLFGERSNHTTPESLGFQYQPSLDLAIGPPYIQLSGYTTIGNPITGPRNSYENAFDYSGALSWVHGRHEMKFGGGFQHMQINVLQGIGTNGFFVFAPFPVVPNAFASFLFGQPVFFLQGRGDFSRGIRGHSFNAYAQDTYKVTQRLTLNYGLRYEMPSPYTEIHNRQTLWIPGRQSTVMPDAPPGLLYPGDAGVPGGLIPTFRKGFAPRVGFAWDPTGSSKWLVTSAYGLFYEPYYTGQGGPLQAPISAPPYLQTLQISLPNFADPFNGNPPLNGQYATPLTNLTLAPNIPLPYAQDWDFNVQRSLGANLLLQVGYVGTKGTKLPRFVEANPAVYIPGVDGDGNPISTSDNADHRRLYSGCTLDPDSPPCTYSSTGLIEGIAASSYNALEASLKKRFSHGLSFLASYTYSKSVDDASSFNMTGSAAKPVAGENDLAQNPFDLAAERGRSLFDARHRLVFSYQWSLPFWRQPRGWYQQILGNWQVNGIATVMTGTPFTVFDSTDFSVQGSAPEISGFFSNRPNLVSGQDPNAGPKKPGAWLNAAAFQKIIQDPNSPVQQFGSAGRNIAQGPGYANWDFSAFKNFRVTEGKEFQFRAEFFNILNHTNFRLPDSDISSPTFNTIQAAQSPRVIQLALKFLF
ncbi:MAG: TonB-dependent receptor [Acidobacteria bacterium]|nr:TonB-dependent receptor [Acidobacteriota bacterium]